MSYYNTCPDCGAHLDPGEACDCVKEDELQEFISLIKRLTPEELTNYLQQVRELVDSNV